MHNLFLVIISILVLDFHSIRYAWIHLISKLVGKSLNCFYHTLNEAPFDHRQWGAVTADYARRTIPDCLKNSSIFLSIDDTMVEKYGTKFEARSKLFDHAAHNGSNYLNGHCFVSVMLHVPVSSPDGIVYLSVPLGYRLWTKKESKLELAAQMVRSVMPALASCKQVILLCDSWYPKKPIPGLVNEFLNLEIICNVRVDTVFMTFPVNGQGSAAGRESGGNESVSNPFRWKSWKGQIIMWAAVKSSPICGRGNMSTHMSQQQTLIIPKVSACSSARFQRIESAWTQKSMQIKNSADTKNVARFPWVFTQSAGK